MQISGILGHEKRETESEEFGQRALAGGLSLLDPVPHCWISWLVSLEEEFGQRALAGGNMWDSLSCLLTLLDSFDKNNPEMRIDSVARQMHQKTVQHYWVNIVKQQVTGGGCPTLRDTLIQPM